MTVAWRLVRDRSRGVLGWSAGMVGLVLLTVVFYPAIKDQGQTLNSLINSLPPAIKSTIGLSAQAPITSPPGYLNARLFAILAPVLVIVFAIGLGTQAIAGLEESGQLEPLLANPITRVRVAVERYLAAVGLLLVVVAVLTVSTVVLSAPFGALEGVRIDGLLGACAALACLALLHGTVAFTVGAARGRRAPAIATATVLAATGYLIQSLQGLTDLLDPFRFVNPWHWYSSRNMLIEGIAPEAILGPLGVSAVLFALAVMAFQRRDLR